MKRLIGFLLAGLLLLSACGGAEEGEGVEVHDPWGRAAPQGDNSAVYLLVHNHTAQDDELIGASSEAAEAVEIHKSIMGADGVMRMVPQSAVPLPADGEVEFTPGGLHIMLVGLKLDLKVGDSIQVTLHFKSHEDILLTVPVMDAADMDAAGMDDHKIP